MATPPKVLCNDDGWILSTYGPPLTLELMREAMIATYADSPVDTFLWSVGGHDVFDYETEVGERVGAGYAKEELDENGIRRRANLAQLIAEHGGPVTAIAGLCREAGLGFYPSVRMNEHYDMATEAYTYSRLRREHPEYLIGHPREALLPGTQQWGISTGLNYARPEVRAYMLAILGELIDHFDIDGIELDFMRHPAFFRIEEAYASRYLATDLVRQVRQRLDTRGQAEGRKLNLAIRVPPTLDDAARIGLDTAAWIEEGLPDLLIAGGGFRPFEMPIAEFVEAAAGTGCRIYGCLEALAGCLDEEKLRGICSRYWDAGVDGLYLFNYHSLAAAWKHDVLGRLANPAALACADKRYEADSASREPPTSQLGWSFRNALPLAQLPVLFADPTGRAVTLTLDIADDVPGAGREGSLATATLGLDFSRLPESAVMEISINDHPHSWSDRKRATGTWTQAAYPDDWSTRPPQPVEHAIEGDQIELALDLGVLRKGENLLRLRRTDTESADVEAIELKGLRLTLRYH